MANTLRIKRSTGSSVPSTLANAELAYAEGSDILYIGTGTSGGNAATVYQIASGSLFTSKTANYVYAAPNGSAGAPSWRALAADDVASGTFAIGRIPTGTTSTTVSLGNHTHGNITSDGKIGTTASLPVITTTAGTLTTGSFGVAGGTFCSGNDSRLVGDGDKGDITVGMNNTVWTIDNSAVTYAKIQNVTSTDRLLGRVTAGAGVVEEITCTAFARSILDDADGATVRATIGAGAGSVTSVALSLPNIFGVTGSPVTSSGTLTAALTTQSNNFVFAGATGGAPTTPTFRALVATDLPTHTHAAGDITSGTLANVRTTATNANTASAIVARDANGDFSCRNITGTTFIGSLSGNAASASSVSWSNVQSKPTTISGFGITDAYTKTEIDTFLQGLDVKASVKAATTGNITLSGAQTIDGISLVADDRVLVKDQTTASTNGIYVVAAGAWARATDFDAWAELPSSYFFVEQGTVNGDNGFVCTADLGGTLGSTAVTFAQFSGAGQITAGTGLTKTGNTLNVGSGTGIVANTDDVALTGQALALHNLGTNGIFVRTAAATIAARSVAVSGNGIAVTNGDGVSGNPTLNLATALSTVGGLTPAADRLAYYDGASSAALATFTAAGRALIDDADASAQRTTLGLGTMATQAANNVAITGGSIDNITIDGGSWT